MMESEKVKLSAFLVQGLATLSIASIACLTGITFSWPSYTVELFESNATVLAYPMSPTEVSIFGSIPNIGALVATPFCGYAMDKFGRKKSAMLFGLPFVLAWLTISLTTNVPLVIAAVGFAGLGVAGQAGAAVYVSEIAQDSIRGGLSSCIVAGLFVGLLTSYTIGGQLSYTGALYANLTLSILYMIGVSLLKESPSFLVRKGKEEEAKKSLAFYRQVKPDSKEVEEAIRLIKLQLGPQIDQKLYDQNDGEQKEELLTKPPTQTQHTESPWKFLRNSESSKRALCASLTLMISNTLMGAIVLQVYAEPLFSKAVPTMTPNLCSILLAVAFLLSVISCALIVDRFGRKFLMTTTSIASGALTSLIGAQLVWDFAPHWCTAVFIYSFAYINYLGAATVPFIFMAEVFLPEVRGLGNSITMASLWTTNFFTLVAFKLLDEMHIGLGPIFFVFSAVCFATSVYSHLCLPETKGMSADQIQVLFIKKRRRSVKFPYKMYETEEKRQSYTRETRVASMTVDDHLSKDTIPRVKSYAFSVELVPLYSGTIDFLMFSQSEGTN
ncbi:sugar transporter domain-containing protein [Phthorimaea operculella]|nr:sugar transporter domain-containing protein [Phthorimaea operculella]